MTCKLCLLSRTLVRSHIMPEFVHKSLRDEKRIIHMVGQGRKRPRFLQKGEREKLLCEECEGRFQRFEDYFARHWCNGDLFANPLADTVRIANLDYARVKLFLLSLVWRASVAKGNSFRTASLGSHEERMRQMLLNQSPGTPNDYPIWAGLLIDPVTRMLWDNAMMPPVRMRVRDLWCYRTVLCGAAWTVRISPHGNPVPEQHCLRLDQEWILPCVSWQTVAEDSGFLDSVRALER